MKNGLIICIIILFIIQPVKATEYDPQEMLKIVETLSDASPEDVALWRHYLNRSKASSGDVREMIAQAAAEFKVPAQLLEAVGYVENNWMQIGPTIDRGWGVMHLVENDYCDTLGDAAVLLGVARQVLKDDPLQNIRGAAALLASYAREISLVPSRLEDWVEPLKKLTGLDGAELQEMQTRLYYSVLANGVVETNLFNQKVEIIADTRLNLAEVDKKLTRFNAVKGGSDRAAEYPGAVASFINCNYKEGRSHQIDTWVEHWMGEGTYAGCISWFHNSSAKASTHFAIRHTDGEITQMVSVNDTSWNCGSSASKDNNSRSIAIEHEATLAHPEWWGSDAMQKGSAKLTRFFCDKYQIPIKRGSPGIEEHQNMPGCSTDCAGNIPWDKLMALISGNDPNIDPTPNPNPNPNPDNQTKTGVIKPTVGANVRKGPSTNDAKITALSKGVKVTVTGKVAGTVYGEAGDWYSVVIPDGRKGYIYAPLVAVDWKSRWIDEEDITEGPPAG
ncbi:MAG: N-acetylmuramoyl-L-alanine amidase [Candidatus Wallbacteria bacterium]|nr:N-acetylmuramoyl-L-alanine amidase [Candidatus Wallbacteria bacterium]